MDDDAADWLSGDVEPEPEPPKIGLKKGKAAEEAQPEKEAEAPPPAAQPEPEPEGAEEDDYLDPDKLLLFKHWIRPRYLQYKYIYDYRKNYYDDVMEVVNSRRKGYKRSIPRPQTWAERVLRTYSDPIHKMETFDRVLEDVKLVTRSEVSGRIYKSQSISNFNRRYTTKIDF